MLLTLGCIATQAPLFVADRAPSTGPSIVMLSANLRLGQADPVALVKLVREHRVQVLAAQELTPAERSALGRAGLDEILPYSVIDARDSAAGVGLWSSFPLHGGQKLRKFHFAFVSARIALPAVSGDLTVAATHPPGPWPQPSTQWLEDIGRLPETLRSL